MSVVNIDKQGRIFLRKLAIGYLTDEKSAVVDTDTLGSYANRWLMQRGYKVEWKAGVILELEQQMKATPPEEEITVRVYQMSGQTLREKGFLPYDQTIRLFGMIDPEDYHCVFEGNLRTQDLEEIFAVLNMDEKPESYNGHSLSVSDVVELVNHDGSSFHYCDSCGYQEIPFQIQQTMTETNDMSSSL